MSRLPDQAERSATGWTNRWARAADTALDRAVAPGYTKIGLAVRRRLPGWPADPDQDSLRGARAMVTGATSGLGLATALGLLRLGAQLHLVVRNEEKGCEVASQLRRDVPGAKVEVHRCDLGDLDDVRRFAATVSLDRLDVLVHNAGLMPPERTESAQGHELTMAVHLLGPVLMTDSLRPALAAAGESRVILVTSGGMYAQRLRADDPEYLTGEYAPTTAYARSKRAQIELLPVLDQRWGADGIGVHAMHPGWADTPGVVDSLPGFHRLTGPVLRDAEGGADTTVWLAASQPPPDPGQLWHDRRPRPIHLFGRNIASPDEVQLMWSWVQEQLAR